MQTPVPKHPAKKRRGEGGNAAPSIDAPGQAPLAIAGHAVGDGTFAGLAAPEARAPANRSDAR